MTAPQTPAPAVPRAAGARPTPEAAAWIREHAWTQAMRKTHRTVPGLYSTCLCQSSRSRSHNCAHNEHGRCIGGLTNWHTIVNRPGGTVAQFSEPYAHPTDSATGPQHEHAAFVWLADRVCRWACPCDCHTAPAPPPTPVQGSLFAIGASA